MKLTSLYNRPSFQRETRSSMPHIEHLIILIVFYSTLAHKYFLEIFDAIKEVS